MKRGMDHTWKIYKYNGDIMLYAVCRCGFRYGCSSSIRNEDGSWSPQQEIKSLYAYCPQCGARKKSMTDTQKIDKFPWE